MMMNALSQVSKDTDIGKQMAYMRNYINQLRDEIENDLMNIGYDNLDADLRKRFDDMQTGLLTANNTSMEVAGMLKTQYLKADEIAARYITAQTVAATYATITSLNSAEARIGTIESNYVNTQTLVANYATITSLNAVDAKFTNLNADYITAGKLTLTHFEDINGSTGAARWATLGWCDAVEKIGTNKIRVYYRDYKFLTCGWTDERTVDIDLS